MELRESERRKLTRKLHATKALRDAAAAKGALSPNPYPPTPRTPIP